MLKCDALKVIRQSEANIKFIIHKLPVSLDNGVDQMQVLNDFITPDEHVSVNLSY